MTKYWKILMLVLALAAVSACSTPAPQTPAPPQQPSIQQPATPPASTQAPTTQTAAVDGKDLYDKNCAGCHGAEGKGGKAPKLNTSEWSNTGKLTNIVKSGKEGMPAFQGKLKDEEIQALSNYVASLPKVGK